MNALSHAKESTTDLEPLLLEDDEEEDALTLLLELREIMKAERKSYQTEIENLQAEVKRLGELVGDEDKNYLPGKPTRFGLLPRKSPAVKRRKTHPTHSLLLPVNRHEIKRPLVTTKSSNHLQRWNSIENVEPIAAFERIRLEMLSQLLRSSVNPVTGLGCGGLIDRELDRDFIGGQERMSWNTHNFLTPHITTDPS